MKECSSIGPHRQLIHPVNLVKIKGISKKASNKQNMRFLMNVVRAVQPDDGSHKSPNGKGTSLQIGYLITHQSNSKWNKGCTFGGFIGVDLFC